MAPLRLVVQSVCSLVGDEETQNFPWVLAVGVDCYLGKSFEEAVLVVARLAFTYFPTSEKSLPVRRKSILWITFSTLRISETQLPPVLPVEQIGYLFL